jgi:hypothetical protein
VRIEVARHRNFSIGVTHKQAQLRTGANVDYTYPDIAKMIPIF